MALLDTTALIDLSRRPGSPYRRRATAHLTARLSAGDTLFTSRINEAEFRVGPLRAAVPASELAKVEAVLATLVILEFDAAAARRFAAARARLLDVGRPAGEIDVLIAAVALANGEPLVTRNPRHFADVPGLVVETY